MGFTMLTISPFMHTSYPKPRARFGMTVAENPVAEILAWLPTEVERPHETDRIQLPEDCRCEILTVGRNLVVQSTGDSMRVDQPLYIIRKQIPELIERLRKNHSDIATRLERTRNTVSDTDIPVYGRSPKFQGEVLAALLEYLRNGYFGNGFLFGSFAKQLTLVSCLQTSDIRKKDWMSRAHIKELISKVTFPS
jgi:hypothetical protein